MKELMYQLAVRTAPAIATGLSTLGVAQANAEVVALGLAVGLVSFAELGWRWLHRGR